MHWLIGALVSPALLSEGNAALLNNPRRLMDKPLWGLRVEGPLGRRF